MGNLSLFGLFACLMRRYKLKQEGYAGLVTWGGWWEESWAEVCCATGFHPEVSLAAASSAAAREPPVLQEEVEGRLGREGGGGRRGGRELVCWVLRRRRRVAPRVPLMTTRVPLVRGAPWRVHLPGSRCLRCRSDQVQGCESHTLGRCCCKDGQGLLLGAQNIPQFLIST